MANTTILLCTTKTSKLKTHKPIFNHWKSHRGGYATKDVLTFQLWFGIIVFVSTSDRMSEKLTTSQIKAGNDNV